VLPQLAAVLNAETQLQLGIQFEAAKVRDRTRMAHKHCMCKYVRCMPGMQVRRTCIEYTPGIVPRWQFSVLTPLFTGSRCNVEILDCLTASA
jgi:hypothetical protein